MALVPLSSEETVVGTAIQEFTDGLQSRLPKPLNTPDFFQLYDDVMLNEVIKEEKKKALDRFGHDNILFEKFSVELEKVITQVETSLFLKAVAKNVCDHFQASVETYLIRCSGLENETEDYINSLIKSKVDDFRLSWGHLNTEICDALNDMLKERKYKQLNETSKWIPSSLPSSDEEDDVGPPPPLSATID